MSLQIKYSTKKIAKNTLNDTILAIILMGWCMFRAVPKAIQMMQTMKWSMAPWKYRTNSGAEERLAACPNAKGFADFVQGKTEPLLEKYNNQNALHYFFSHDLYAAPAPMSYGVTEDNIQNTGEWHDNSYNHDQILSYFYGHPSIKQSYSLGNDQLKVVLRAIFQPFNQPEKLFFLVSPQDDSGCTPLHYAFGYLDKKEEDLQNIFWKGLEPLKELKEEKKRELLAAKNKSLGQNILHVIASLSLCSPKFFTNLQPIFGKENLQQAMNSVDVAGNTPLHVACQGSKVNTILEMCSVLLPAAEKKESVSDSKAPVPPTQVVQTFCQNKKGENPLHILCRQKNVAKCLQEFKKVLGTEVYKQKLQEPDSEGNTPLHLAVQAGELETVRLLLADDDEKIQLGNKKNIQGDSPVALAVKYGQADILKQFLAQPYYAAEIPTKDKQGKTLLDHATAGKSDDVLTQVVDKLSSDRFYELAHELKSSSVDKSVSACYQRLVGQRIAAYELTQLVETETQLDPKKYQSKKSYFLTLMSHAEKKDAGRPDPVPEEFKTKSPVTLPNPIGKPIGIQRFFDLATAVVTQDQSCRSLLDARKYFSARNFKLFGQTQQQAGEGVEKQTAALEVDTSKKLGSATASI